VLITIIITFKYGPYNGAGIKDPPSIDIKAIRFSQSSVLLETGVKVGNAHQFLLRLLGQGRGDPEVLEEVVELLGRGLEVVLLHVVPDAVDDDHLEPALHLRDDQLLVEALLLSGEEDLGDVDVEEDVGESLEPP
jgi:hypothetical protein